MTVTATPTRRCQEQIPAGPWRTAHVAPRTDPGDTGYMNRCSAAATVLYTVEDDEGDRATYELCDFDASEARRHETDTLVSIRSLPGVDRAQAARVCAEVTADVEAYRQAVRR